MNDLLQHDAGAVLPVYAGIGSRTTPEPILLLMRNAARMLEREGFVLRSGGAAGADTAFESGVTDPSHKQIFLPYARFRGHASGLTHILPACFEIAATVHPNWSACSAFARKAHARNVFQVLGYNLHTPAHFVLCWTPDGAIDEATSTRTTGGTRTAIVLAARHGIPVRNLARPEHRAKLEEWVIPRLSAGLVSAAEPWTSRP